MRARKEDGEGGTERLMRGYPYRREEFHCFIMKCQTVPQMPICCKDFQVRCYKTLIGICTSAVCILVGILNV